MRNAARLNLRLLQAAAGIAAAAIVLVVTRQWLAGISNDSVAYIAAARGVIGGAGLVTHVGDPLVSQPPLYPLLLSITGWAFGSDPLLLAHFVNAVLCGCVVWLSAVLFLRHLGTTRALAILGVAFLPVAGPLFRVSIMAWSEPLFLLLTLVFLIQIGSYVREGRTAALLLASVAAALACLTRYIGVAVILSGIVSILTLRKDDVRLRVRGLLTFVLISILPLAGWLVRNQAVSGTLFGPRVPSGRSLVQNLGAASTIVAGWYAHGRATWLLTALLVLVGAVGVLAELAERRRAAAGSGRRGPALPGPILTFAIVYAAVLLASATTTAYDELDTRLLMPVFVPATLGLLMLFRGALEFVSGRPGAKVLGGVLTAALVILLLALPSQMMLHATRYARGQGWGYGAASWRGSPTVRHIVRNRNEMLGRPTYSNAPKALYLLANVGARLSPGGEEMRSRAGGSDPARLRGAWPPEGRAYLVWFDSVERDYLFPVDVLEGVADVAPVARLTDGAIYVAARR